MLRLLLMISLLIAGFTATTANGEEAIQGKVGRVIKKNKRIVILIPSGERPKIANLKPGDVLQLLNEDQESYAVKVFTKRKDRIVLQLIEKGRVPFDKGDDVEISLAEDSVTHDGKKVVDSSDTVERYSSAYWREKQKFSLVTGVGFAPLPGSSFAAGYYLTPSYLLEAAYFNTEIDLLFAKFTMSLIEARIKMFFYNSFYTDVGFAVRNITGETTLEPLTGDNEISSSLSVTSYGALIAIGNRWQWEYFSLGCDWIGSFYPISTGEITISDSEATDEDIQETRDSLNDTASTSSGMFLRFYLGVSF